MTRRRVLLLEPWYGGSHRAWADGLVAASGHDIELCTHPAVAWRWRLRGGAVTMAELVEASVEARGRPDVVLASGMLDLARVAGLTRRSLAGVPLALYLHENQLAFPAQAANAPTDDQAFTTWTSMAAADAVWCNSAHHRAVIATALDDRLHRVPDLAHDHLVAGVLARTGVLAVGVDTAALIAAPRRSEADGGAAPLVVWNQRWDHDKDPGRMLGILLRLADAGVAFEVALAGENRRTDPREITEAIERLGRRVVHVGHLDRAGYVELLLAADVVVSVARHEFFGIAVVEAMAAGAVPLLPARLSYPELIPAHLADAVLYRSGLHDRLRTVLEDLDGARRRVAGLRQAMAAHDWSVVAPRYDAAIEALAAGGPPDPPQPVPVP